MTARRRTFASRATLAAALFLVLGGPSPGAVGDCTSSTQVANAAQFCTDKETWLCARLLANNCTVDMTAPWCDDGSITMEEGMACVEAGQARCMGANWPSGCAPTQAQADACIRALMNAGRLTERDPPAGFPECALCTGTSSGLTSDEGEEPEGEPWSE